LQLATEQGEPVPPGTADLYTGLSELRREHDDLEAATQHLLTGEELGAGLPENRYRWCVAMARIREAQGDLDGALDLLDEAERLYMRGINPNVHPVAALKTRLWVAQGRLTEAFGWAREQGLSVEDDLSYLREFEHITLARVLIARYKSERKERSIHEAVRLLERLLNAADEGGWTGSVIEILVLQALAHEAQGDIPRGLAPLERALSLAEPEGYVRIFVGEGEPMRDLLRHAAAGGVSSSFTRRLLSAFDGSAQTVSARAQGAAAELIEPLTAREVEILRLVAAGMRNQEIADQLVISVSTVKRHNANAYGKLGVSHRTEAVARANELNLI
jgi:LuxR family maltose regulon positive regulatory protein